MGQDRASAFEATDNLWSTNFSARCWDSFEQYAEATSSLRSGGHDRDVLAFYCFENEDHWKIWFRKNPENPSWITYVDVKLENDRFASIDVRSSFHIDP